MEKEYVLYKEKEYIVLFKYSSGYWEIRDKAKDSYSAIEVVHESELIHADKEQPNWSGHSFFSLIRHIALKPSR